MSRILIVEDDVPFGLMLKTWFSKRGDDAEICMSVASAQKNMATTNYHLVLSDLRLPDSDGILLLQWIKAFYPTIPVIIMTNYADIQTAVASMRLGAYDFLEKPIQADILNEKIQGALSSSAIPSRSKEKNPGSHYFKGKHNLSEKLHQHIDLVAPTQMSVLISGESGTGKEYVAHYIHEQSKRSKSPFVAVDCGAISRELGGSELFGHKKGSFTSAIEDKIGVFEKAEGGTLFLDEIGNLSMEVQMQLLRAIQERKIKAIGSLKEVRVDVRIISATNENLKKAIEDGRFREDLYHRINEFNLEVPPLRERGEDLLSFAHYFLNQANIDLEKNVKGLSAEVEQIFMLFPWTGNLRQMNNVVKRAVLFCKKDKITKEDLPDELIFSAEKNQSFSLKKNNDKELILEALTKTKNNKSRAAQLLGIDRKTLYLKMKELGIA